MARKSSATLTDAELRLMRILWARGPSMVGDVVEALPDDEPLAYSTVLTTLRILERKGYLRHEQEGRAYVYYPIIDEQEARHGALRHLMHRFFDNSAEMLVLNMLESDELDAEDLDRLKRLLDEDDTKD